MKTEVFFIDVQTHIFEPLTDQKFSGHRGMLWLRIQDLRTFKNAEKAFADEWKTTGDRGLTEE
jgi:hypothetical protein